MASAALDEASPAPQAAAPPLAVMSAVAAPPARRSLA